MQYTQLPRRGIILFSILLALVSGSCDVVSNLSDLSANAGSDQTVLLGETVQLDGSGSIDLLGGSSFTYAWSFTSTPSGSAVTISSADQSGATFTPDEVGTYLVQLTISNGDESDTDEVTITVEEDPNNPTDPPFPLEGSITESRTLAKVADSGPDYVINSFLSIEADVTIEPGVIIQLGERAGILITDVGSLTAEGTADNVITFTGATQSAGYWGAISFGSNTSANRLSHVVIEYGGADGISFITEDASVILLGNARLSLEDVIVRNSGSYGLNLSNSAASVTLSGTNTFTLNDTPILSTMQQLGSLSSADSYSGNTHDFVEVINDGAVDSDATWPALDVPYMMPGNVAVLDADVVLSAGSEFVFAADGGVSITQNGSLNAVGTSTNAIIFRGENDERGFWRGLEYNSNNTDNRLEWVEVKNGGSRGFDGADLRTNIIIQGSARLEMVSVTTSKCSGYGLYLRDADVRVPTFSLNVAFENEAPIYCWPQHYGYFDTDSDLVGNDDDYIDSQAASASVTAAAT
ncbi:MAG TPA: hypothetical protein DCR93_29410, partial [Cytophagales bacterium]|nr:hypothetical protein [Cytophagales bacterium]